MVRRSESRAYTAWKAMKARCLRKTHRSYAIYGGRGITVCDQWMEFSGFYEDMGDPPTGASLERIDNNKGYSSDNCRWAKWTDQMRNRRNTVILAFKGSKKSLAQWCEELEINYHVAFCRYQAGFNPKEILSCKKLRRRGIDYITRNGVTKTLHGWCQELGLAYDTIRARVSNHGWDIEKALTTPIRRKQQ